MMHACRDANIFHHLLIKSFIKTIRQYKLKNSPKISHFDKAQQKNQMTVYDKLHINFNTRFTWRLLHISFLV